MARYDFPDYARVIVQPYYLVNDLKVMGHDLISHRTVTNGIFWNLCSAVLDRSNVRPLKNVQREQKKHPDKLKEHGLGRSRGSLAPKATWQQIIRGQVSPIKFLCK